MKCTLLSIPLDLHLSSFLITHDYYASQTIRGASDNMILYFSLGAPKIINKKGPTYVLKGDNVTLPACSATGFPIPVVSWRKVYDRMPQGRILTTDETLTIMKTKVYDSGIYLCTATNSLGSDRKITHLIVLVKPRFLIKPPKKIRRFAGSPLTITCSARSNPPSVISWERCESEPLHKRFTATKNTLATRHLKTNDAGMYACVATSTPLIARAPFEIKVKIGKYV